jgi:hypothetical protein
MQQRWRRSPEGALSRLLIVYLVTLHSILLLVHVLQPAREGGLSPLQSPAHQDRRKAR